MTDEFELMAAQVFRFAFGLLLLGAAFFFWQGGVPLLVSFILGGVASLVLLFLLHRTVRLLDITGTQSPSRGAMTLLGFGQLAVFAAVYAIIKVYEVNIPAMGTGLFVGIGAITLQNLWGLLRKT